MRKKQVNSYYNNLWRITQSSLALPFFSPIEPMTSLGLSKIFSPRLRWLRDFLLLVIWPSIDIYQLTPNMIALFPYLGFYEFFIILFINFSLLSKETMGFSNISSCLIGHTPCNLNSEEKQE